MKKVLIVLAIVGLLAPKASATAVIGFANSDSFDGDGIGGTAGPFLDSVSGELSTMTTTAITPGASLVNTTAGQLGINAPGTNDLADSFDLGESWSFAWDKDSQFVGIDFGNYSTTTENQAFSVQSGAWIGLAISPGSANVLFSSATGTFTFKDGTASDIFTLTDLYDGGALPTISAGTDVTISYSPTSIADNALIQGMSFNLIPEPTTFTLLGLGSLALVMARRRK